MPFPTSPSNNDVHKVGNRAFTYDSTLGTWDQVKETDRTENKIFSGDLSGVSGEFPVRSIGADQAGTCSFMARKSVSNWYAVAENTVLSFDNASSGDSHDTDGCYNTSKCLFRAPAAGIYYFFMAIYTAFNDTSNGFNFTKNGKNKDFDITNEGTNYVIWSEHGAEDIKLHGSMHCHLVLGDWVQVQALTQSDWYSGHSHWGGFRLR